MEREKPRSQITPTENIVKRDYYESKIEGKPVEIFIKRDVLREILQFGQQGANKTPRQEVLGNLYGRLLQLYDNRYRVFIEHVISTFGQEASASHLRSDRQFGRRQIDFEKQNPQLDNVGWWHTHLNPNRIFLSSPDLNYCKGRHRGVDHADVALVVQIDQKRAGFFIWEPVTTKK